jgi:hypothetical protein
MHTNIVEFRIVDVPFLCFILLPVNLQYGIITVLSAKMFIGNGAVED